MSEPPEKFHIPQPSLPNPDERAEKENQALALGMDLENKGTENKLNRFSRRDKMDGHLHLVLVCLIYFVAFLLACLLFAMTFSMLFEGYWLSEEKISEIREFLFTGGVGAGLATLAKYQLGSERND